MSDFQGVTEQRLQTLEDKEAIKTLQYTYFQALDRRDLEQIRDVFVEERAVIDFGEWGVFEGRDAFVSDFKESECQPGIIDTHHGQNMIISINGDEASSVVDLFYTQLREREKTYAIQSAYYHIDYSRTVVGWRILKLVFKPAGGLTFQVSDDHVAKIVELGL